MQPRRRERERERERVQMNAMQRLESRVLGGSAQGWLGGEEGKDTPG